MKWAWTLGTIAGTKVRIHVTFLILLIFLAANFWSSSGPRAALVGVAFFLALFLCVVLHEFGHALAARRYGIRTPDITLYPIGGIARLERMPKVPSHELVVAAAGPAVNVVIAILLFLVVGFMPPLESLNEFSQINARSFFGGLMWINIVLVIFNLIPAFPMDGGRMLRALLAMTVPHAQATRWAANIGQGLAIVGAIFAIMTSWWWLLIIAAFIFFAAGQEASMIETQATFEGLPVRAAMETRFQSLRAGDTMKHAAEVLLEGSQHDFPVIDANGACTGLLLRTDLMRALANGQLDSSVAETAQTNFPTLSAEEPLTRALESLTASNLPVAPVIDSEGQVEGLLTRENVAELLTMRSALSPGRRS